MTPRQYIGYSWRAHRATYAVLGPGRRLLEEHGQPVLPFRILGDGEPPEKREHARLVAPRLRCLCCLKQRRDARVCR
jgi:hypothetical protein